MLIPNYTALPLLVFVPFAFYFQLLFVLCYFRWLFTCRIIFVYEYSDVLLGDYLGLQVAVKVLKDKSMVQQFLTEAYVMTYVAVLFIVCLYGGNNYHCCF